MSTIKEKYENDYKKLIDLGGDLKNAIQYECFPEEFKKQINEVLKEKATTFIKEIPSFKTKYQTWYSESKTLIKQILPDRLEDFIRYYEKLKTRKEITYENYTIEDYLVGLTVKRGYEKILGPEAAIPKFDQQMAILKSIENRFLSSLYDIKIMVQADLFDSELDEASELVKYKYFRSASALAGVVLEKHLKETCEKKGIKIAKKNPTINDYNEALKEKDFIDTANWRFIQHLADIRNLCDHSKNEEPKNDQIRDMIDGVKKIIKTVL
jgi:hypothetical protein